MNILKTGHSPKFIFLNFFKSSFLQKFMSTKSFETRHSQKLMFKKCKNLVDRKNVCSRKFPFFKVMLENSFILFYKFISTYFPHFRAILF